MSRWTNYAAEFTPEQAAEVLHRANIGFWRIETDEFRDALMARASLCGPERSEQCADDECVYCTWDGCGCPCHGAVLAGTAERQEPDGTIDGGKVWRERVATSSAAQTVSATGEPAGRIGARIVDEHASDLRKLADHDAAGSAEPAAKPNAGPPEGTEQ